MCEAELLMSDLRGEIERLETQLKTGRDKITTLEERVREMAEQIETAPSNSYLQPELRELEQIYRQGIYVSWKNTVYILASQCGIILVA